MEISNNIQTRQTQDFKKSQIPVWVKCIGWPLIVFSAFATLALALALISNNTNEAISIGLFGFFYKGSALHPLPIGLIAVLLANTIAGYRLLSGKPNAVLQCLYIAYFTMGITLLGKLTYYPTNYFPFEPVLIAFYIITLHRLKRLYQRET
ncbi:hypothetical protein [Glaciecola sp. SC05]|uniref:hypothetical protein n=1 Tax=Glaciecola sp. SC05 TaxID=1987355 RepID=UPI0035299ADE